MAHNINTYVGRQSAWHGLGLVTGEYQTSAQLLAHEGFQFGVFVSQLTDKMGREVDAYATFRWNNSDQLKYNGVANYPERTIFLGTVGKNYQPIPHANGFAGIDQLVQSVDGAHYETAGVLGDGQTVWALADLKQSIKVGDDEQKGYVLFCTSHDGTMSYQMRTTLVRVVCQNTLSMALSKKATASFKVKHTKNAGDKIVDAHAALAGMASDLKTVESKLNLLAGRKVTKDTYEAIMARLFPLADTEKGSSTRRDNILAEIMACYESNDNNAFPTQRGTAYNLLNAITEHTDHYRGSDVGKRQLAATFGSGDDLKSEALEVIYEVAGQMPGMETKTVFVPAATKPAKTPKSVAKFDGLLGDVLAETESRPVSNN